MINLFWAVILSSLLFQSSPPPRRVDPLWDDSMPPQWHSGNFGDNLILHVQVVHVYVYIYILIH